MRDSLKLFGIILQAMFFAMLMGALVVGLILMAGIVVVFVFEFIRSMLDSTFGTVLVFGALGIAIAAFPAIYHQIKLDRGK